MGQSTKGALLVAAPQLVDPNFRHTVVLVADHDDDGAFGLVLNRPGQLKLSDVWSSISEEPLRIEQIAFVGGPVQRNALVFLHGHPDLADGAEPILPGVYLGSEPKVLSQALEREAVLETAGEAGKTPRLRVYCGYSGWGPGQLDAELKDGGWLVSPASPEQVFHASPEVLWSRTIASHGGVYEFFAQMPPDPELN